MFITPSFILFICILYMLNVPVKSHTNEHLKGSLLVSKDPSTHGGAVDLSTDLPIGSNKLFYLKNVPEPNRS